MLLKIGIYDTTIIYIPCKDIPLADCLSRLIPKECDRHIPDFDVVTHEFIKVSSRSHLQEITYGKLLNKTSGHTQFIVEVWSIQRQECD